MAIIIFNRVVTGSQRQALRRHGRILFKPAFNFVPHVG
jgi:hypothetical protein